MKQAMTITKKTFLIFGCLIWGSLAFGQNNAPVAVNDYYTVLMNTPISENVLNNDTDPDGDNLIINTTPIINPNHGVFTSTPNGLFTYIPNVNYIGQDTFQYMICDDGTPTLCDTATVYLNVIDSTDFIENVTKNNQNCNANNTVIGSITIETYSVFDAFNLEYSIDNGMTWLTNNGTFTNLDTGSYHVLVREVGTMNIDTFANNPVVINFPATPTIVSINSYNPSTCSSNDGTIEIRANSPWGGIHFSINGGNTWDNSGFLLNGDILNVQGGGVGVYDIRVRHSSSMCYISGGTVTLSSTVGAATISNVATIDPTNSSTYDGTITITASGGTVPLRYSIGNYFQTSNTFTGLPCGTYPVYVRNADYSCSVYYGQVTLNCDLEIDTVLTNLYCINNTNDLEIITQFGSGANQYSIDSGLTWQSNNLFTNLTAGNYNVIVTDGNDTLAYANNPVTVITATAPILDSITTMNPSVCGVPNGSIVIHATGSNIEYSIDGGINWFPSNTFNNIATGTYLATIRNTNGTCQVDANNPIILTAPNAPSITNVATTNPTDCSVFDGTITITATGGSGSYEYSIDGGATWWTANTFSGLWSGSYYQIRVRNNDGTCQVTYPNVTLTAPNPPTITNVLSTNVSNCGGYDGSITIFVTGGQTALEYSISGGTTFQPSNTFTGLVAGTYQIRVRNANGTCQVTYPDVTLSAPNAPIITNVISTNPTCGLNDGSITIFATGGGQVGLSYSFSSNSNLGPWFQSNTFMGLQQGTYHVGVRSNYGTCQVYYGTVTLTQQSTLTLNLTSTDATCGTNNGTATVIPTGGTPPYTYMWDNGIAQSTSTITNLIHGTYYVTVIDAVGCIDTGSVTIGNNIIPTNIDAGNDTTVCINSNNIQLNGFPSGGIWYGPGIVDPVNGIFNAPIAGGIGTYTLFYTDGCSIDTMAITVTPSPAVWVANDTTVCEDSDTIFLSASPLGGVWTGIGVIDPSGIFAPDLAGVGTYTLTYTYSDSNSCVMSATQNITVNPLPIVNAGVDTTFCATPNDILLLTGQFPTGGVWTGNGIVDATLGVFNGISAGGVGSYDLVYTYTVTNGCSNFDTTIVTVFPQPVVDAGNDTTVCVNSGLFTLNGNPLGGAWSGLGVTGGIFDPSIAGVGTYDLYFTVGSGTCMATDTMTITVINPPTINAIHKTDPTTCATQNGTIVIDASGTGTLEYSIDFGVTWQTSDTFSNLGCSFYPIGVRDSASYCTSTFQIIALTHQLEIFSVNVVDETCNGNDNEITINSWGGYINQYSVDSGLTWQSSNSFQNLTGGVYNILVKDTYGYTVAYVNNPVLVNTSMPPTVTNVNVIHPTSCAASNGSIEISANSPLGVEYSVGNNSGATPWSSITFYPNRQCITYDIRVRNGDGTCPIIHSLVTLQSPLAISNVNITNKICGQGNGKIKINAIDGTVLFSYFYSIDSGSTWQTVDSFTNLTPENYHVLVTDGNDTLAYANNPIVINEVGTPTITAMYGGDFVFVNSIAATNLEYSLDCGATWQNNNFFNGILGTTFCSGVRYNDGSCPLFSTDTFINTVPIAINDSISFPKLNVKTFNILTNDVDAEGNHLYVKNTPQTINLGSGSITIDSLGNVTVPTANFNFGTYNFDYIVCESYNPTHCDTASVAFTIYPPSHHIFDTIAIGATAQICIPNNLNGTSVSLMNVCGTIPNVVIDSVVGECLYLYADNYGDATTCFVRCDNLGDCDTTFLHFTVQDGVWPGDADDNTIVNNFDLLNVGLGYGTSGTARDSVTNLWNGYITPLWNVATPISNVDYRHLDCNGDGLINSDDTLAILQNYGFSYQRNGGGNFGTPLAVGTDTSYVLPHFTLPINLGELNNPAADVYGGAFSILYDTTFIKKDSVFITFNNSWVGTNNVDMISLHKNFGDNQQIDVAFTRINGTNVTGFGEIGQLNFTIKDDILQRGMTLDSVIFDFYIINVKFISADEQEVDVAAGNTSWVVKGSGVSTQFVTNLGQWINIFPNPATNYVQIQSPKLVIENIIITDGIGKTVLQNTPTDKRNIQLNVGELPQGVYHIQLQTEKGTVVKQLVILE